MVVVYGFNGGDDSNDDDGGDVHLLLEMVYV